MLIDFMTYIKYYEVYKKSKPHKSNINKNKSNIKIIISENNTNMKKYRKEYFSLYYLYVFITVKE
jgi:hypothetical protein